MKPNKCMLKRSSLVLLPIGRVVCRCVNALPTVFIDLAPTQAMPNHLMAHLAVGR